MPLSYINFDVRIIEKDDNSYFVAVRSPFGEATEIFRLPFDAFDLPQFIQEVWSNF